MESSGDANRYIKPDWNYIPSGAKLYPTILYLFGIKDRNEDGSGDEHKQEHQEEKASTSKT